MLLRHIGYHERATRLEMALDICGSLEKKVVMTGRSTGAGASEYVDYLTDTMKDDSLDTRWKTYLRTP
jgi:hypothetical protein